MRTVFAASLQQPQVLGSIVLIIAVRIANSMQSDAGLIAAVRHDIQTVKGTQQSLRHADIHVDHFDVWFIA